MKTKTLILSVSLELLNRVGESNVSGLDIANEIGISPGNLYYHYKGKTDIVEALTDNLKQLLQEFQSGLANNNKEENWLSLYVLLEHIYHYRFLFRNPADLSNAYPESKDNINQILYSLFLAINDILESLTEQSKTAIPTDVIVVFFINWVQYRDTIKTNESDKDCILAAMIRLEILLSPYIDEHLAKFITLSNHSYKAS